MKLKTATGIRVNCECLEDELQLIITMLRHHSMWGLDTGFWVQLL